MDLTIACRNNDLCHAKKLLSSGWDPDGFAPDLVDTPLLHVYMYFHTSSKMVKLFLQHKADPDIQSFYGKTALMFASKQHRAKSVKLLLQYNANIDLQNSSKETALLLASSEGHIEIVNILLQHNANPDLRDFLGRTALMLASKHNHIQIVNLLLQHNANPDLQNDFGESALMLASSKGHTQIVKLLQNRIPIVNCLKNIVIRTLNKAHRASFLNAGGRIDAYDILVSPKPFETEFSSTFPPKSK